MLAVMKYVFRHQDFALAILFVSSKVVRRVKYKLFYMVRLVCYYCSVTAF